MRSDNISRAPFNTVTSLHLKLADDAQVREFSDKDSVYSVGSISRNRRANKIKNPSMKSIKGITKNKNKNMDYTNYAYNEAVGRLKFMLAESYTTPKTNYLKSSIYEDPTDNFSDSVSAIDRPVLSDISKYLSPNQKARLGVYRPKKLFPTFSASKENLVAEPAQTQTYTAGSSVDYYSTARTLPPPAPVTSGIPAPVEIFDFIEKQEDYIQQLEKESKFCRNELSNLLEKVKDVINENEALTETARSELAALTGYEGDKKRVVVTTTTSSESEDIQAKKSPIRKKDTLRSPRYANAPKIVYEARISELEAELMQSNIDLKRLKQENAELQRKLALADPVTTLTATTSCEAHRKQIEQLQLEKSRLEDSLRHSQKALDEAKAEQMSGLSSKRYVNDLMQMERSQAELEVKHLRDELDRQHERVRELQHEMARRIADERSNAERRYNNQVDQLGGDLSNQWEQVAKLQMELERQKRYESDMKRDLSSRNAQIEDLKQELRANRSAMLADMAQINAEKQSLEQEITSLRLQLDRAAREHKTEAARLNAEISSLRQRLDRGDADLLHSKREVLRLNDEIANLEKELAYGEIKNEVRPTKKDLDQRISEMQTKHEPPPQPQPPQINAEVSRNSLTQTNLQSRPIVSGSCKLQHTNILETQRSMEREEGCISPNDPNDDSLTNITKSCRRLSYKLAKLPPLPKYTPLFPFTPSISTNMCKKRVCWAEQGPAAASAPAAGVSDDKMKNCQCEKRRSSTQCKSDIKSLIRCSSEDKIVSRSTVHCCCCRRLRNRSHETNQLPWMQQHLVLNQTFNNCTKDNQLPVQCTKLTESTEMTSEVGDTTTKMHTNLCQKELHKSSETCSTPSCYFQKLLTRNRNRYNESQLTKKPISVDITLNLVPKHNKNERASGSQEDTKLELKNDDINMQSTQL